MTAQVGAISVRSLRLFGTSVLTFVALSISQPAQSQFVQQGPKLVGTGWLGSAGQGLSVALSADGNTAIVGGSGDSTFIGAAWVFTRSEGVSTQQGQKLVGTGNVANPASIKAPLLRCPPTATPPSWVEEQWLDRGGVAPTRSEGV